jgi:hypothetical protein
MDRSWNPLVRLLRRAGRWVCVGAVLSISVILSCASEKVTPKDEIGDEEYRVMSAVLKDYQAKWRDRVFFPPFGVPEGSSSAESKRIEAAAEAKAHSLHRRYGLLASFLYMDTSHTAEFYDTLVMRFGCMAYYVARDSVNGKVAYDSLRRKRGDLSYYIVLYDRTGGETADSSVIRAKEFRGMITPELVQSYNENNREQHKLKRERFSDSLVVDLTSRSDFDSTIAPGDWWPAFYERYPLSNGGFSISRAGFNSDSSVALISMVVVSGRRSGIGLYCLLQKKDGIWVVVAEEPYLRI